MYAVFQASGKQHKVAEGDVLKIDKLDGDLGSKLIFDQVMMVKKDDQTIIGTPFVANAAVKAEIVEHGKAKKIIVFKFHRRHNYQRKQGHRQQYTAIRITQIAA